MHSGEGVESTIRSWELKDWRFPLISGANNDTQFHKDLQENLSW